MVRYYRPYFSDCLLTYVQEAIATQDERSGDEHEDQPFGPERCLSIADVRQDTQ